MELVVHDWDRDTFYVIRRQLSMVSNCLCTWVGCLICLFVIVGIKSGNSKVMHPVSALQEQKSAGKKNRPARQVGMVIKVKPQAKRAKLDQGDVDEPSNTVKTSEIGRAKSLLPVKTPNGGSDEFNDVVKTGLVSYSDESEEDD